MATIILENARVRVGLLQAPCLVFSHELAGHHVFDHMPATGSLPRSSAPSRYRLRCVVRRSVLPRERFSPLGIERTFGLHGLKSAVTHQRRWRHLAVWKQNPVSTPIEGIATTGRMVTPVLGCPR